MGNKRVKPEGILTKLRRDEVLFGQEVAYVVVVHGADEQKTKSLAVINHSSTEKISDLVLAG
jgi:hypothetical protein